MLHLWLPYALVKASAPALTYATHLVGLSLSLVLLCTSGSLILRILKLKSFEATNNSEAILNRPFPLIATQITLGALASTGYFIFRSLLCKVSTAVPHAVEMELPLILTAVVLIERHRRGQRLLPDLRYLIGFLILLTSILVYGRWHFFNLSGLSSDPAVLSGYLEIYRRSGQIPFVTSDINPTLPTYPAGFFILLQAFANPLLPSVSLVHIWLYLSAALAAGLLSEWFIVKLKLPFKWGLVAALFAVSLKLWAIPIDLNNFWRFLEGVPKRSLFCCIALGVILLFELRPDRQRNSGPPLTSLALHAALLTLCWMFPFWVNPTNFYVSAAGMLMTGLCGVLFLRRPSWTDHTKVSRKTVLIRFAVCAMAVLGTISLYSVQDPLLLTNSRLSEYFCQLYADQLKICTDANLPHFIDNVRVRRLNLPPDIPSLESLLPAHLGGNWLWWAYPSSIRPLFSPWSLAPLVGFSFLAIFCLATDKIRRRKPRNHQATLSQNAATPPSGQDARFWLKILGIALIVPGAYVAINFFGMFFQVLILVKVSPHDVLHMVTSYTEQSYFNVWGTAVLVLTAAVSTLFVKYGLVATGGCGFRGKQRALLLVAVMIIGWAGAQNYEPVSRLKSAVNAEVGRGLFVYAQIYDAFGKAVRPNERVLIPSTFMVIPSGERWVFPSTQDAALAYVTEAQLNNSYPNFWLPSSIDLFEHERKMCTEFCQYMANQSIDRFAWIGRNAMFCNSRAEDFAKKSGCLKQALIFEPKGKKKLGHKELVLMIYDYVNPRDSNVDTLYQ